jgi:hypothetical protein
LLCLLGAFDAKVFHKLLNLKRFVANFPRKKGLLQIFCFATAPFGELM